MSAFATKHTLRVQRETSHRTAKPRASIKLYVCGPGGGVHAVLMASSTLLDSDRRLNEIEAAFERIAADMRPRADYLCTCPTPSAAVGHVNAPESPSCG